MTADTWTVLGTVLTAVALAISLVQTIRYRIASALLRQIHQRDQIANWALYDMIVQTYDCLHKARAAAGEDPPNENVLIAETNQASAVVNSMWLRTVERAAILEPEFNENTIARWEQTGRLDSVWRLARARKLLPSPPAKGESVETAPGV